MSDSLTDLFGWSARQPKRRDTPGEFLGPLWTTIWVVNTWHHLTPQITQLFGKKKNEEEKQLTCKFTSRGGKIYQTGLAQKDTFSINCIVQRGLYWLVGGFNPSEKYSSKWESSPNRDEHKNIFETTTYSWSFTRVVLACLINASLHMYLLPFAAAMNSPVFPFLKNNSSTGFSRFNGSRILKRSSNPEISPSWWFQPIWKILVKLDHFPK